MTRRESREQAFALLFEKTFRDLPVADLAEAAMEARDTASTGFALELAGGAEARLEEIDRKIMTYSRKWNKERMSRVAISAMRLAVYELLYQPEIPVSIAINEAVELAKKYGGEEDSSFVNGILGSIAREPAKPTATEPV